MKCSSELTETNKDRDLTLEFRSVRWAKKCSQRAQSGRTKKLHGSTGPFYQQKQSCIMAWALRMMPMQTTVQDCIPYFHPAHRACDLCIYCIAWEGWSFTLSIEGYGWSYWITCFSRDLMQIVQFSKSFICEVHAWNTGVKEGGIVWWTLYLGRSKF